MHKYCIRAKKYRHKEAGSGVGLYPTCPSTDFDFDMFNYLNC